MGRAKLTLETDRELLAFIFARFIDGEFTGLKEGYALNRAPNLEAADFLARQIRDEIRHANMYRTLYEYTAATKKIPPSPRLLTLIMAPVTGRLWLEHCFLDKALGERWVLCLMETLIETVDDRKIVNHLKAIAKDERTHIAFGEEQTRAGIGQSAFRRFYLWGLYLRVDFALALAFRLTRSLIQKRYSTAAAALLTDFFSDARARIRREIAELVGVPARNSLWQLFICQLIFLIRLPCVGWLRNPRKTF
ncbi:MAG: ferritin-like domain-containing protein [Spirochaetes bacterium]|nr:ferritin-like domain-containing protein [Spirochaetota bacterium]MBX3722448.1 ferritin-like domain-containing protein [Turneriella sp.]